MKFHYKIAVWVFLGLLMGSLIGFYVDDPDDFLGGLVYAAAVLLTAGIETLILLVLALSSYFQDQRPTPSFADENILDSDAPETKTLGSRQRMRAYLLGIVWVILFGSCFFYLGILIFE